MYDRESKMAELRLDYNMKQKDIAEILYVSSDTYSKWERGVNDIPLEMSNKLANYYGVSLDYLLELSRKSFNTRVKEINFDVMKRRLLELRKEKKLSQEKLGLKIGFRQKTYCNYETGRCTPTSFKLYCIATYYNVSIDWLLGKSNSKNIQ